MMALHQRLEPGLDLLRCDVAFEPERLERLALGISHRAGLGARRIGPGSGGAAELPEHAERIYGAVELRLEARRARPRRRPAAVHAHLPGRAVADHGLLLVAGNVVRVHAGEEIITVVVLADMIETELPVLALAQPPLRRTMRRRRLAVRPFASRALGAQSPILVGLDPDPIEQGRVAGHDRTVCAPLN